MKTVLRYTKYIPITKDEYKSHLTSAVIRGAQRGCHLGPDTSDYGGLLLEQRWPKYPLVYIFLVPLGIQ